MRPTALALLLIALFPLGCSGDDGGDESSSPGAGAAAGSGGSAGGPGGSSGQGGAKAGAAGQSAGGQGGKAGQAGSAGQSGSAGKGGAQAGGGQAGGGQAGSAQAGGGQAGGGQAGVGQAGSGQAGSGQAGSGQGGASGQGGGGQAGSPAGGAAGASGSSGMEGGSGGASGGGSGGGGSGGASGGQIGAWTDAPGECPAGMPRVDITTAAELASASRGEDAYAGDAPATCYFVHDGVYQQTGVVMYVKQGGEAGGSRRVFVGESRAGVVIKGRASLDDGVGDVTIENLTFDLTGYQQSGSFDTLTLGTGKNITVSHVSFTGDCATGLKGGHIETNGTGNLLVEACLIEKFGHCSGGGHEDHGVYLASGSHLTFRNNVIRGNSSRGIQFYTAGGDYGTIDTVLIEQNLIEENGHADYEDGIVINSSGTGTVSSVTIRRNVFARNYYSGVRFVGGVETGVSIEQNTFVDNGAGSSADARSELNIDDMGGGAGTSVTGNLFQVGHLLLNDCYDGKTLGFSVGENFVSGGLPDASKASCIGPQQMNDPQLVDPAGGDYHPQNPAAQAFGAYAP